MPVFDSHSSTHSETLVFIGAGATAMLGMPSTQSQTNILRELSDGKKKPYEILKDFFYAEDLKKVSAFLKMLDETGKDYFYVSQADIEQARVAFGCSENDEHISSRILELRRDYDWNALKMILKICPHNKNKDSLVVDVFSIIDKKLLTRQSLKVSAELPDTVHKHAILCCMV